MVSAKRIAQLAKKWQRVASLRRKQLTTTATKEAECCSMAVAGKGCCVMYTADGRRFEVPLAYLGTLIFRELLHMSQEEFGFVSGDGRITLPCDATVMQYIMFLLGRNASVEIEKAFLSSMMMPCHYTSSVAPSLGVNQQMAVCSS
ncbi:auxin-responsive protein SAUR36-like [Hordeum vulgare subsp. vulgare]|uniref:auxin-responsive protein SAUR36-like n=1 Tax=Hordeum vulgare subsp. vulgare TaxID=112509 RepID=UPI0002963373|nr:auxin-responsive protein SAUR36-like [Hordeum vulgare subsp. vulgare]